MATISIQKFQSYWRSVYKGELEIPFSEQLLSILFYQTDVGQIPRGKAQSISPASSHCNDINWKKAIPGCYWCSNGNTGHQGICCSPNCLLYFHEWCVRKVKETTESAVCLLPGCEEENVDKHHSVCSEGHKREYLERYSIVDSAISSPKWYIDRAVPMPQNKSDVTMMDESNSLNSSSSNSSCNYVTRDFTHKTNVSRLVVNEFENIASAVQNKIKVYFSQLIETLTNRQAELISELEKTVCRYKQQREKIIELEKLNKLHKEMYSQTTVKTVLDDITVRVESELSSLKESILTSVEFEWNQSYAKEASKLGKLIHRVSSKLGITSTNIRYLPPSEPLIQISIPFQTAYTNRINPFDFTATDIVEEFQSEYHAD